MKKIKSKKEYITKEIEKLDVSRYTKRLLTSRLLEEYIMTHDDKYDIYMHRIWDKYERYYISWRLKYIGLNKADIKQLFEYIKERDKAHKLAFKYDKVHDFFKWDKIGLKRYYDIKLRKEYENELKLRHKFYKTIYKKTNQLRKLIPQKNLDFWFAAKRFCDSKKNNLHYMYHSASAERKSQYSKMLKFKKSKCEICGSRKNLELHHKIPFSEITDPDKIDWKKETMTLCRECHLFKVHKYYAWKPSLPKR